MFILKKKTAPITLLTVVACDGHTTLMYISLGMASSFDVTLFHVNFDCQYGCRKHKHVCKMDAVWEN